MIEAHGLVRRFGTFTAVAGISLSVPDGSVLALLGPNGAGKTTTVRMLSGLLAPSEGEAKIAGYNVCKNPAAVRNMVGLVTDVPGLYEQMTTVAYLDMFGCIYGMSASDRTWRIRELLELFELTEQCNTRLVGFSKGMKQKVALARALIHEPEVLFLDEPTSGLDPLAARVVRELIQGLKHSSRTIILCTHDLDEAERLADTIAIMRKGSIVAYDTAAALRAQATREVNVQVKLVAACPVPLDQLQILEGVNEPHFIDESACVLEYRTMCPAAANPLVIRELVLADAQVLAVNSEMTSLEDVYASAMGVLAEQSVSVALAAQA